MIKKQTMIFPFAPSQVSRALTRALEQGRLPRLQGNGDDTVGRKQLLYWQPGCKHPDQVTISVDEYPAGMSSVDVTVCARLGKIDWDPACRLINDIFNIIYTDAPGCAD